MPYGAREHKQRRRNVIEEKNVVRMPSFPIVSTIISKKGGAGFSSGYTFITVSRNYTSEWNDY